MENTYWGGNYANEYSQQDSQFLTTREYRGEYKAKQEKCNDEEIEENQPEIENVNVIIELALHYSQTAAKEKILFWKTK